MSKGNISMTTNINGHIVDCSALAREVLRRGMMTRQEMRDFIWSHPKDFPGLQDVVDEIGDKMTDEMKDIIADQIIDSLAEQNVLCPYGEDEGSFAVTGAAKDYIE